MATIPSIAMIPSGYKASKVYSVLPTDGTGDLTFSRAGAATRVNSDGFIEEVLSNVPRFDYSDGGCPSLLVEPQSTNLSLYSEDFTNANWIKTEVTITANVIASPDNAISADKIIESIVNTSHNLLDAFSVTNGLNYTFSIFAKASERKWIKLDSSSNANWSAGAFFDLENGVVGTIDSGTAKIENYGNGWFRCSITGLANATTGVGSVIFLSTDSATISYAGDGVSGVYLWGAQIEALPYATSYIPTVASTVTRVAETVSKTGISDLIGQSEGTLFIESKVFPNTSSVICLHENTLNNNRILINFNSITNQILFYIDNASVMQVSSSFSTPLLSSSFFKAAFAYKENDCSFFINGVKVGTDILSQTFSGTTISRLSFSNATGSSNIQGSVKNLQVYTTALTDEQLIALTQ
jgi:hypothetical protein